MEPSARKEYNENFTAEKYERFLRLLSADLKQPIAFRVAETPVFLTNDFLQKLLTASSDIINVILKPDFKRQTEKAIPDKWRVANENDHPHFIALDFGVCEDADGNIVPQLIELQGFPSLYGFQVHLADTYQSTFDIPEQWGIFFNSLDRTQYLDLLKRTIVGRCQPDEVALMDVNAHEQKTAVDFYLTQKYLGIPVVSLTDLVEKDNKLFYKAKNVLKPIKRIYNRLIFDEIENDPDIFKKAVDIRKPLEAEWITHPNWFYRISKFTMPLLSSPYVPVTQYLDQVKDIPADLENYVLKPLFSFAGQGVMIDVTREDINNIKDKENWILQQKVNYAPVIKAPDGDVKLEIRLLYLWPDEDAKPTLVINLARLSRGKMIGVRYNKDFDWVGGTVAFMRKDALY